MDSEDQSKRDSFGEIEKVGKKVCWDQDDKGVFLGYDDLESAQFQGHISGKGVVEDIK